MYRTAKQVKRRVKNKGSIRADFEEGDTTSEEEPSPGPGGYLKQYHTSTFGQQPILHDHPQQFGHLAMRFRNKNEDAPGPGQYLSQNMIEKFKPKQGVEGTNNFKAPGRDKLDKIEETPGPQTYKSASMDPVPKASGNGRPFIFNEKRFTSIDFEVPGAGAYNIADGIKVNTSK